jgi:two-component system cell cycle sensor histidine kinase/response regulator CckA
MLQSYAQFPEREAQADFSVPYLTMAGSIFARRGVDNVRTLEDLRGRRVLVHAGSLGEQVLKSAGLSASIVHVPSVDGAFLMLERGEGDATLAGRLTGLMAVHRHDLRNVTAVGEPVSHYQLRYCFAVRDGDRRLLAQLNEGMAIIERTGVANEIYQRWFGPIEPTRYSALQIALAVASGLAMRSWSQSGGRCGSAACGSAWCARRNACGVTSSSCGSHRSSRPWARSPAASRTTSTTS